MKLLKHDAISIFNFIAPAIGAKIDRSNLMCASFLIENNKARIMSADGSCIKLVEFRIDEKDCDFLISERGVKRIRGLLKEKFTGDDSFLSVEIKENEINLHDLKIGFKPFVATYPNLDKLIYHEISTKNKHDKNLGVSPGLVKKIMIGAPKDSVFKIQVSNGVEPIMFESQNIDGFVYRAVLMPTVCEW